jgi:opacity protein-like surface antigen
MKKVFVCLALVCVLAGGAFAAGGDPSENGISTSPLKIWGSGIGGGGFLPLSDEGKALGKVIWLNTFDFTGNFALCADIDWYISDSGLVNFGIELGGDYAFLADSRVSPFLGAGVEAGYFEEGLGMTFGGFARVGIALKLTNTLDIKVRVPFHAMMNGDKKKDMGFGFEVGAVFYSRLRNIKSIDY